MALLCKIEVIRCQFLYGAVKAFQETVCFSPSRVYFAHSLPSLTLHESESYLSLGQFQ